MAAALPSSEASGYSEVFRAIGGGGDITVDQFKVNYGEETKGRKSCSSNVSSSLGA